MAEGAALGFAIKVVYESGIPKIQELREKLRLVQNRKRTRNSWNEFGETDHINEVENDINKFVHNDPLPDMALNQIKLLNCSQDMKNSFSTQLETLCGEIKNLTLEQETGFNNLTFKIEEQYTDFAGQIFEISQQDQYLCCPPDLPSCLMGFDKYLTELKELVLEAGLDVVGVTGMGGAGKSTLAVSLCHHPEIKDKKRVIYINVSESPDLPGILKTMWKNIAGLGGPEPNFTNVEDAHNKLHSAIKSRRNEPILVVLDDIWGFSHLKKLLFKGSQFMTVVTTRNKHTIGSIPTWFNKGLYPLPSLQEEHALSLFCFYAFGIPTIPNTHNEELVKQVHAECKGLPLALQVIGSSLNGKHPSVWENANRLSTGEPSNEFQMEGLLNRLKTSIDLLKDNEKQCFLDLAAFPQGQVIPANALLDIWVYVRGMTWPNAVILLRDFAARHLLNFKRNPWIPDITGDSMNGYSFSQHDIMRNLALYLAKQENSIQCKRLYMPKKKSRFPSKWQTDRDLSSKAQIVSIHTGAMKDTQWPELEFPEAEALLLYFTASEYCIPTFLHTMKKLKVLMIHNDSAKRTKLTALAGFQVLSQLKSLRLERLIVPPLYEYCNVLKNLQKLYLSLCEGLGNMSGLGRDKMLNFPGLLEINVDYCSDLEELPAGICSSNSLKMLSITHCHGLAKLPDELGKLGSLKEIRLTESPGLKELPPSISSLRKLEYLDISSCMGLKADGRRGSELKKTLKTLAELASLKKVICDKDHGQLFKSSSRTGLQVEVVEEEFDLNWLDW
ncbi:hypothetical protein SUGI_0902490 [Cryptomeria japonica]|nr:hypothetical protein SUGI_0902490 [Cryptomeria japonica]